MHSDDSPLPTAIQTEAKAESTQREKVQAEEQNTDDKQKESREAECIQSIVCTEAIER
jgi:hypothetical protein